MKFLEGMSKFHYFPLLKTVLIFNEEVDYARVFNLPLNPSPHYLRVLVNLSTLRDSLQVAPKLRAQFFCEKKLETKIG